MKLQLNALRPFIGAKDYNISRLFYSDLGFEEIVIDPKLSLFKNGQFSFYLQDAYNKDWIENTMLFLEVPDAYDAYKDLETSEVSKKYPGVKLIPARIESWGAVCFLLDPSGVLLQFGHFLQK